MSNYTNSIWINFDKSYAGQLSEFKINKQKQKIIGKA